MSVTAYPVILVDSATGSDSAASGAGPSTALTGSLAVSTGTTVVLDAGTVLTGVATDGSHVLYFADATSGNRNFTAINGKSGSGGATPTVTVEQTLATTTKAWAIGGKRATWSGAVSFKLLNNNSSPDAAPGWTVEMQSGHTESTPGGLNFYGAGSASVGPIILRGKSGAASIPVVTLTGGIVPRADMFEMRAFKMVDGSGSHSIDGINCGATGKMWLDKIVMGDATNYFSTSIINLGAAGPTRLTNCEIAYSSTQGIRIDGSSILITGCYIHHNAIGIKSNGVVDMLGSTILDNEIVLNTSHGLHIAASPPSNRNFNYSENTFDNNGGDGARLEIDNTDGLANGVVENNIYSNNGGYGCNWNGSGVTGALLRAFGVQFRNNDFFNNTSGPTNLDSATYTGIDGQQLDPTYVGGGDYTPTNAALAGTAYPTSVP